MALNQTTLISEVASQIVRTDVALIGATGRISKWLNWGLTRIDRFCDLKGLGKHVKCACVVNQTEYAFPADLKYVRTFRLLDHILTTFDKTDVNTTTNVITVDEDIATGTLLIFLSSDPPAPLVTGTVYYAINLTSTTISVATTSTLATAGTAISLTDTGSDATALEIFNSSDSRILTYVPEREFDVQVPDIKEISTGKAERYIDREDIFELEVPPDARYTLDIRYVKWQDELSASNLNPEVDFIDDLIVAATVVEAWVALGESKKAAEAQMRFMHILGAHRAVDRLRPDYAPIAKGYDSGASKGNIMADAYKHPFMKR
jgi:hypothetical protein